MLLQTYNLLNIHIYHFEHHFITTIYIIHPAPLLHSPGGFPMWRMAIKFEAMSAAASSALPPVVAVGVGKILGCAAAFRALANIPEEGLGTSQGSGAVWYELHA
jgi:hypothetical protein